MTHDAQQGFRTTFKTLAGGLLLGTALILGPVSALAQDAAAPAANAAPAQPAAPTPDTVVATIGDQTITQADLAFAAEDLQQELAQVPAADREAFLVTVLLDMKLMSKAAKDAGMNQTDIFKRRLSYLEDRALRRAYFAEKIAGTVTEEKVRAAYDKYVADFKPVDEIHARHILVPTEEEAKAVKAELDAGKPFEVVAMEKTTDPSGKQNGGDLGFFSKGMMVPQFEEAAFALQPGQVSEPVQSQFGWHIIKVEETRQSSPPPFEQVAQQLGQQLMYEAFDKASADLKAGVTIDIPDPKLAEAVKRQQEPNSAEENAATQ